MAQIRTSALGSLPDRSNTCQSSENVGAEAMKSMWGSGVITCKTLVRRWNERCKNDPCIEDGRVNSAAGLVAANTVKLINSNENF